MNDTYEAKWEPTQDQIDTLILPAYNEMAKKSISYINLFQCPPEYVADMLRDIADALISSHPASESECSCC
tara:strand:- start:278 stop:490 length:213 start_codon:yes stop_codon:yes gene_type:complete